MDALELKLREEICEVSRRMYQFGFSPCTSGNISARLAEDVYLITPSGVCKADLTPDKIVKMNGRCEVLDGKGHASSEGKVHVYAYEHRPDVMGVCHAHAPCAVTMSSLTCKLDRYFLPDQVYYLGAVPRCEYAPSGSYAVAESMAPYIDKHSALLLGNHGAVTMGGSVSEAFYRLEMLEQYCKVAILANLMGGPREFTKEEADQIFEEVREEGIVHPGNITL